MYKIKLILTFNRDFLIKQYLLNINLLYKYRMGIGTSLLYPVWSRNQEDFICRIMTYNVEWGFLKLPNDVTRDSCGNTLPHTPLAQNRHLILISKNIGIVNPEICFLQEMGSIDAVKYVADQLRSMFNLDYSVYYSNSGQGYQGVGLLIKTSLVPYCTVEKIPNFMLNRAIGIRFTIAGKEYKIAGLHLKSLYDHNYKKDIPEQLSQIAAVNDWINDTENAIICGDFNNIFGSTTIKKMSDYGYIDILETGAYIPSIMETKNTEFNGKDGKEQGSRIDYIFTSKSVTALSGHIINFIRENKHAPDFERKETSDHLPLLGIFKF